MSDLHRQAVEYLHEWKVRPIEADNQGPNWCRAYLAALDKVQVLTARIEKLERVAEAARKLRSVESLDFYSNYEEVLDSALAALDARPKGVKSES